MNTPNITSITNNIARPAINNAIGKANAMIPITNPFLPSFWTQATIPRTNAASDKGSVNPLANPLVNEPKKPKPNNDNNNEIKENNNYIQMVSFYKGD